jgi:hypothetical protein
MKYEWIEFWAYANFASLIQYVEEVIKDFGNKWELSHKNQPYSKKALEISI